MMATSPGMLQSWYSDFSKDKGVAAPAPAPRADGLDQRAIDADPAGFAKWQADKAVFDAGKPAPAPAPLIAAQTADAGQQTQAMANKPQQGMLGGLGPAPAATATTTEWKPDTGRSV